MHCLQEQLSRSKKQAKGLARCRIFTAEEFTQTQPVAEGHPSMSIFIIALIVCRYFTVAKY
jgi:hypothetical protein